MNGQPIPLPKARATQHLDRSTGAASVDMPGGAFSDGTQFWIERDLREYAEAKAAEAFEAAAQLLDDEHERVKHLHNYAKHYALCIRALARAKAPNARLSGAGTASA